MTTVTSRFVPELLLGVDELGSDLRRDLVEYLGQVIRARGFPLHTNIAWNAVYFGYDPDVRSYTEVLLESDMPDLGLGDGGPALPLGAITWVHVGGKVGQVWAEVVGKDGRPPGVGEHGGVEPDMAGRAAAVITLEDASGDGHRPVEAAVLDEALICDFAAFGRIEGIDKTLTRLENRNRLLDHQLIASKAIYVPPGAAADSDSAFYARWLFEYQRPLLEAGPLGASLTGGDPETLRAGLLASLTTVDLLLSQVPGVVRWGDYALLEEWVDELDMFPNLPLHAGDLEHLLIYLAGGSPGTATTALLPVISQCIRPSPTHRSRPDWAEPDPLAGTRFLKVIATSSRWMADRIDASGGVLNAHGTPRLLRIDDPWPWGGLWRSEPYGPGHPLAEVPADEPLYLGSRGYSSLAEFLDLPTGEVEAAIARALAPAASSPTLEQIPSEGYEGRLVGGPGPLPGEEKDAYVEGTDQAASRGEEELEPTFVSATAVLRQVDIETGTLPLPDNLTWVAGHPPVSVKITHSGEIDDDQLSQRAWVAAGRTDLLEGLDWPVDFFAGIRLHLVAFTGGNAVFAATRALDEPVEMDGRALRFSFDPSIVGRQCPDRAEPTLADILVGALARHGRPASDGSRRASPREILNFCFGPGYPAELLATVTETLAGLVGTRSLSLIGSEYSWSPVTSRNRFRRQILPTSWEPRIVHPGEVRQHWVPPFLRRLPAGYQASDDARRRYRQDRAAKLIWGPRELPFGFTYVRGFERGSAWGAYRKALSETVVEGQGRSPSDSEVDEMTRTWEAE